jgi:hypothetical protein
MDVSILAKELAVLLAPVLSDLLKMGGIAAEEASKKLGVEVTGGFLGKLRSKIQAKPAAQEAVKDFIAAPNDEDALGALRLQLKKILSEDENLANEVSRLLEEAKASNVGAFAKGDRSVAIGGNVSDSVIVIGDHNQVR